MILELEHFMVALPKLKQIKQFSFPDPHNTKVYEGLKRGVGKATASFYKDACKIYYGDADLESKTHLIGHLLREILGDLTTVLLPVDYKSKGKNKNERKIKKILKIYKIKPHEEPVQLWLGIVKSKDNVGLHRWAHRRGLLSVRPQDEQFDYLWNKVQVLFTFLIDVVEKNFVHYVDYLDGLLAKSAIAKKDLDEFKQKIPCNTVTLGYFFERLDKPDCLNALVEKGFFDDPIPPFEHPDGGISYPYWPQMTYLVKMSKIPSIQDKVLEVCLGIETDNIRTQAELLEVAINLPGKMAVQIVEKSYSKLDQINSWFHPEKYGALIVYFAKERLQEEALNLARKVLAIKPDPRKPTVIEGHTFTHDPIALFDDWHYEKILNENYPGLVEKIGMEAIKVLLDLIQNYVNLSDEGRESGSKDDYSDIWRPAIEDNSQNHKFGVRDLLVTALRNACEQFIKSHPDQVLEVVKELESRKLCILKRLSLHLLRLFSKGAEEKIRQELMNKDEFQGESRLTHEYFLLAEAHGSLLTLGQREQLWSWIIDGADVEGYKKWRSQNGHKTNRSQVEKYIKNWQMYHLMPFKDIDPKWKEYFDGIVSLAGEPEFPSFRSWSSGGSWGPNSSISENQLKEMEPQKVVEFLEKWQPPANDPLDRTREGTGRQLTEQVASNPEKWSQVTLSFSRLDPTYVRSLLGGYRDALKKGKSFDWKPVLELCEVALSKPIQVERRKPTVPFGEDPDWNWCRNTIVELLTEGMSGRAGEVPTSLREQVWKLIEELTNDPNPTQEYEKEYLKSHEDPLNLAVSSTRGDALLAAIQYGVWLKQAENKETQSTWSLEKNAPELLKVLDLHLDVEKDPSLAIRAVYGEKLGTLTWLDKSWVISKEDAIFPAEKKYQSYFNAAWETYIIFVQPYKELLNILEKQYQRALKEAGNHADTKHHLESPDQRVTQHLMVFYWAGDLELTKGGLLEQFFKTAPVPLKAEAIEFIGRSLKDNVTVPQNVKKRLQQIWKYRLQEVKGDKKGKESAQEFSGFSWWVASGKFDEKWLLEQLHEVLALECEIEGDHLIIEKLIEMASRYPLEVIKCTDKLVQQDKKGWGVLTWKGQLQEAIKTVLDSKRRDAVKLAKELANSLVSKGHLEFKDLV